MTDTAMREAVGRSAVELRDKIRNVMIDEVDSECGVGYVTATHEILATLREALLSDEAVEAAACEIYQLGALSPRPNQREMGRARATLAAALRALEQGGAGG